ncbi:MAG: carbohydrate ABC transporter permease [Chloroflexi bacterium]|nr:carbohydrate ABC transporter permease [Chloroflexota bacterium]
MSALTTKETTSSTVSWLRSPQVKAMWLTLIAMLAILVITFPFVWILLSSLRSVENFLSLDLRDALPRSLDFTSYRLALQRSDLFLWMGNSLFVAVLTTCLSLLVSAPAAFALTRLRFRGKDAASIILVLSYAVPSIMLAIPLLVLLVKMRLNNSFIGLILVHATFTIPFTSWILQDFYRSIPTDLEEAGYIDGASLVRVLWHIILPLSIPGLLAAGAYSFILSWNEFLFALILLNSYDSFTAPVGVHAYFTARGADESMWAQLMAASVIVSLPSVLLFAYFQRYLIAGFLKGAVKG